MTKPMWGCPWHGLVTVSGLTLPNDTTIPFPGPGVLNDTAGDTILLKVPGVPEIERSPEEAAADAAAGRQWWNQ